MGVEAGRLVLRWALGLLCLFAGFSALVASGTLFSLDLWVLALARATRTEAVFYASLAYAHAGALEVVGPALFGLCVFLAVSGRRVLAGRLFVAVAATGILDLALKIYLPQALPPTGVGRGAAEAPILGIAYSYSYPSGHASGGRCFSGRFFCSRGLGGRARFCAPPLCCALSACARAGFTWRFIGLRTCWGERYSGPRPSRGFSGSTPSRGPSSARGSPAVGQDGAFSSLRRIPPAGSLGRGGCGSCRFSRRRRISRARASPAKSEG